VVAGRRRATTGFGGPRRNPMESFIRLIDRLTGAVGVIGAWLVLPLITFACFEVFSRYALGSPTIWSFELGYMLTGANFLLGMAFALRERAHIRIEVLYQHFPEWLRAIVDSLTYALIIIPICGWLSVGLFRYAMDAYTTGETSGMSAWNPVVWPFRFTFTVAFALLALQGLAELARCVLILRGLRAGAAPGKRVAGVSKIQQGSA
jgi:TRAP-type mannitol/chloroaromatic compound transport system permease small subunit